MEAVFNSPRDTLAGLLVYHQVTCGVSILQVKALQNCRALNNRPAACRAIHLRAWLTCKEAHEWTSLAIIRQLHVQHPAGGGTAGAQGTE